MLVERIFLGTLMIAALVGIVIFDLWLSVSIPDADGVAMPGKWAGLPITAVMTLLAALAAYELGGILRRAGYRPAVHWAAFTTAGLVLIPWLTAANATAPPAVSHLPLSVQGLTGLWVVAGLMGAAMVQLTRQKTEQAVAHMGATLFIFIYLGLLGSFAVHIRCLDMDPTGAALVLFAVLTIKFGDIGAYLVGRFLGKTPLVPWLSPQKTVEGLIGAVAVSGAFAVAAMFIWQTAARKALGPAPFTETQAFIFGVVMAIVGHLGDLVESAIKRDAGVKHSSQITASFGGLLDILDSPLFALPVAWWMLTTFAQLR